MEEKIDKRHENSGKQVDQRMKAFLIYEYLLYHSDENNVVTNKRLRDHLKGLGISSERRSVCKDIDAINQAVLMTQRHTKAFYIKDANRLLRSDKFHTIVYDPHKKGYYVRRVAYSVEDIHMLAECVCCAKFIDEERAKRLTFIVSDLLNKHHAKKLKKDVMVFERVKTENTELYQILSTINTALIPEERKRIKFKYMTYTLKNGLRRTERRKGCWYVVSPHKLLIEDGNYYLIGYDDDRKKILHYRIDRMKDVELLDGDIEGKEEYNALNLESYLYEQFSMYSGKREHLTFRCMNWTLDTFVDRFGTRDVIYSKDGDDYFTAKVSVAVSKQLYAWLGGMGNAVMITSPAWVAKDYRDHLVKMLKLYDRI